MTLQELLHELQSLRGQQDQTVRTRVIKLCFPALPEINETNRFLEYMIEEVAHSIHDRGREPWEEGRS